MVIGKSNISDPILSVEDGFYTDSLGRKWLKLIADKSTDVVAEGEAFFILRIDSTHLALVMDSPNAREYMDKRANPGVTYHYLELTGVWPELFVTRVRSFLLK